MENKQPTKFGGRPKGSVNRSTANARKAIADFVDGSTPHLLEWLAQTANGIPKTDANGEVLRDHEGGTKWVVKPDPAGAIKAVSDIAEYHLPKLSRTEATVTHNNELDVTQMSTNDLKLMVLRQAGIDADTIDLDQLVDAEVEPVPVPTWMKR